MILTIAWCLIGAFVLLAIWVGVAGLVEWFFKVLVRAIKYAMSLKEG